MLNGNPYLKPDKQQRAAQRAVHENPVAALALMMQVRKTALARLPKLTEPCHGDIIEDDCAHWFQDERWIEQSYTEPPFAPFAAWSVTSAVPAAGLNVAPLVAAAAKKVEEPVAFPINIPYVNDCLQLPPRPMTAFAEPLPVPLSQYAREHAARLDTQRDHIAHIGKMETPDRRLWHDDHAAWLLAHGQTVSVLS